MNNLKTIGREFYSNHTNTNNDPSSSCIKLFPLLVTLKLAYLENLVEWSEASTSAAKGVEVFPCLIDLKIDCCSQLKTAPTHFPFLKTLYYTSVKSAEALSKICRATTTLTYFRISGVSELTHLPERLLQNNKNLRNISIRYCVMLESITRENDKVGLQNLLSLQHLEIGGCPKLTHIGSMRGLTSLRSMSLRDCAKIRNLPNGLGSCTSLESVRVSDCNNVGEVGLMELKYLNSLKDLTIGGFNSELESFPFDFNTLVPKTSLETLILDGWKSFPQQIQHLTALKDLEIRSFKELETLPDWLGNLSSLQYLIITYCSKLSHMWSMHGLTSLIRLKIHRCDEITNLPIGLGSCTSLQTLEVSYCKNLVSFLADEDLRELKSFSSLSIDNCEKLKGDDSSFQGCSNRLNELEIGRLNSELESFPFNFNISVLQTSLKSLTLNGWPKIKSLPEHEIKHLAALESLRMSGFSGLKALPDWLGNLSSLQSMHIWDCENLKYLPSIKSMRRLTNLESLQIGSSCTVLVERCKKKSGPEWFKISHIPYIRIGGVVVQSLR